MVIGDFVRITGVSVALGENGPSLGDDLGVSGVGIDETARKHSGGGVVARFGEDRHGGPEGELDVRRPELAVRKVRGELEVPRDVFGLFRDESSPLDFERQADNVFPARDDQFFDLDNQLNSS